MQYHEFTRQINVSRETYEKLEIYHGLLCKWQKKINLISPSTIHQIWQRHFIDSLQLTDMLADDSHILDIGSGGGLPAIPLAIASEQHITLAESDERKCIFLQEVKRQLSLNITILNQRIEDVPRETFPIITARACASLNQLFTWSSPYLSPHGKCLFPKGEQYSKEINEALQEWSFAWEAIPSITNSKAAIIQVQHLTKR